MSTKPWGNCIIAMTSLRKKWGSDGKAAMKSKAPMKAAMKSQKAAAPPSRQSPPDDAVWWFCDTRNVKSVWAVAWMYDKKVQVVVYKED